jgi:tetratricopeptide (TPR) repeat protein
LFSFGTTATSYYRTRQQDIHDARAELRGFLQRLSVLPKENLEVMSHPDKLVAAQLSAAINAENSLIANQAAEVMDRIPDYVSAIEYIVVANAFSSVGIYDKAEKLLKRATEVSKDVNEEVGAIRAYAALLFASGNINAGREMFQKALNIHEKYPSRIPLFQIWTNVYTEMQWAAAELGQRQCSESQTHITKASEQVSNFPSGPNKEVLLQQVTQIQKNIDSCK